MARDNCFICGEYGNLDKHHLFGAANRRLAEQDGLYIYICRECHRKIHDENWMMTELHEMGEHRYIDQGHTIEEFRRRYGRNYL